MSTHRRDHTLSLLHLTRVVGMRAGGPLLVNSDRIVAVQSGRHWASPAFVDTGCVIVGDHGGGSQWFEVVEPQIQVAGRVPRLRPYGLDPESREVVYLDPARIVSAGATTSFRSADRGAEHTKLVLECGGFTLAVDIAEPLAEVRRRCPHLISLHEQMSGREVAVNPGYISAVSGNDTMSSLVMAVADGVSAEAYGVRIHSASAHVQDADRRVMESPAQVATLIAAAQRVTADRSLG